MHISRAWINKTVAGLGECWLLLEPLLFTSVKRPAKALLSFEILWAPWSFLVLRNCKFCLNDSFLLFRARFTQKNFNTLHTVHGNCAILCAVFAVTTVFRYNYVVKGKFKMLILHWRICCFCMIVSEFSIFTSFLKQDTKLYVTQVVYSQQNFLLKFTANLDKNFFLPSKKTATKASLIQCKDFAFSLDL